jgi:DNA (cytosine-5)-methyltransferase 1
MLKPQFILNLAAKLVVVLFAGAGGSCTGIEQAIGRHVDIAANHNPSALSCHQRNHPQTRHYREDVRRLHPRDLAGNQPVGYLHLSPDCTHHSQAKGGQPRSDEIRSLSWVALRWAGTVRPDVITLENVREILKWGRLIAKRDPLTGRVVKLDGSVAAPGEVVPRREQFLVPDPKRIGQTWRQFVAALQRLGYVVEWQVLRAADYGVPTKRTRLFMVARCDGMPIVWPETTHFDKPKRGQKAWVPIHTCLDFSIKSQSIFGRDKPLVDATLRRVARGLKKFVLDDPNPFIVEGARYSVADAQVRDGGGNVIAPTIVPITHGGGDRFHDAREPLRAITTAHRGEFMLATHTMVQVGYGERSGQAPRALDVRQPMGTAPAGGNKFALVSAFVEQANGGFYDGCGASANDPLSTSTTRGTQQRLVTAHLAHLRNNCDARGLRDPIPTISAGGQHHALVEYHLSPQAEAGALRCAAFLIQYYSEGGQWGDLRDPCAAITTRDRLALVTVWIKGDPYVIVDICLRMLVPRELALAMSFPPDYDIETGHDGRKFTKTQQVFMIGNAVPPELQRVVTAANYCEMPEPALRRAA